jgi:hypothetical protein
VYALEEPTMLDVTDPKVMQAAKDVENDPSFVLPPAPLPPVAHEAPTLGREELRNRNPELARAGHRRTAPIDFGQTLRGADQLPLAASDQIGQQVLMASRAGTILQIGHPEDTHVKETTKGVQQNLIENAPFRGRTDEVAVHNIPDKWGGRGLEGAARRDGDQQGTYATATDPNKMHGPRKSHEPETPVLADLAPGESLDIVTHGSLDGKMGGYAPKKLANVLDKMGLAEGVGDVNLQACMSTYTGTADGSQLAGAKKSPAELLEKELGKKGVETTVGGYDGLLYGGIHERTPAYEFADLAVDKAESALKKTQEKDAAAGRNFSDQSMEQMNVLSRAEAELEKHSAKHPAKLVRPTEASA